MSDLQKLHAEWQACQPLPAENAAALWQWIRMQFNHRSNHFEGNTLTYHETQLLLIYGRTSGDHELREYEEMKAHDVAFEHTRELAKSSRAISEADIRDLNKICLKEPFYQIAQTPTGEPTRKRIVPGEYKKQPNHVLTQTGDIFYFASPEETPAKMAALVAWLQAWLAAPNPVPPLIPFLAELHQRYIHIHPFDDGNGRVVRLLINTILMRQGYLPMVLPQRDEYIKAIQFADTGNPHHLEALFETHITRILKLGIKAQTTQIPLNESN